MAVKWALKSRLLERQLAVNVAAYLLRLQRLQVV